MGATTVLITWAKAERGPEISVIGIDDCGSRQQKV